MSKIVNIEEYKVDAELRRHMAAIEEQIDETQKSIKNYLCKKIQDKSLTILRTEIQDNHIKIEFIYTEKPDDDNQS